VIRYRPMARRALRELVEFSRDEWSAEVADRYLAALKKRIELAHAVRGVGDPVAARPGVFCWRSDAYWFYFMREGDDLIVLDLIHEALKP
jgi:plasmid stabilization system protein ParE